jgi:uncharacterized phage protein (TIGR02218 family)
MTYDAKEKSLYGGAPVELYKFTSGVNIWRYTDADTDIIVGTDTYVTGWPLNRTEPELSQEAQHSELKITTYFEMPVAWLFRSGSPWQAIWVSVYRKHRDDAETVLMWQGKIKGVHFIPSKGEAEIICDPADKVLGKGGFRQTCGPQCSKQLYSTRCGVSESAYTVYGVVDSVDTTGYLVTSSSFATKPNNFFKLGEFYVQAMEAKVQIVAHTGNQITLKRPINGLLAGMSCRVCAGCDHVWIRANLTSGDCVSKFGNGINFLGFPFVPLKNPYEVGLEG